MAKDPQIMTKKELVRLGADLGLGSKAALDVHHKGTLLRKILDHLNSTP